MPSSPPLMADFSQWDEGVPLPRNPLHHAKRLFQQALKREFSLIYIPDALFPSLT